MVGVQNGDTIYFYGADAEKAGPALKRKVLTRNIPGTLFYPFFHCHIAQNAAIILLQAGNRGFFHCTVLSRLRREQWIRAHGVSNIQHYINHGVLLPKFLVEPVCSKCTPVGIQATPHNSKEKNKTAIQRKAAVGEGI